MNGAVFCYNIKNSRACGSVVEHVPDKNGVEGSIPSTRIMEKLNLERIAETERSIDLSKSIIGFRIFKIGDFDQKSLEQFSRQVEAVKNFSRQLQSQLVDRAPQIAIITNSDLPEAGQLKLADSELTIVQAEKTKAQRRAELARRLVGEKSAAKGDFSYSDMLNALEQIKTVERANYIFASSDLANKPEALFHQIIGMKILWDSWQKERPGQLAMVGSMIEGVHDSALVQKIISGEAEIKLDSLSKVFPNNALSLVPPEVDFSGITDNALAGQIEISGKFESIGGNEDFFYGFEEMLYAGKDCVLLIEPFVTREVKGVEVKYVRRQAVYRLYAQRTIEQAIKRGKAFWSGNIRERPSKEEIDAIVEEIVDRHLFFARIESDGRPSVILTSRQKSKNINSPIGN